MSPTLISYDGLKSKGITLSKCRLWRLERDGKFPKRVSISEARHGWVEVEIDAWLKARINARSPSRVAA